MEFPFARLRGRTVVASGAYAGALLLTVVETPPTTRILVGALVVFALSVILVSTLVAEHGLRSPPVAFFGPVALLLAVTWWRGAGGVDAFVAMVIHLFGMFVVAAVGSAELFVKQLLGAHSA